MTSTPSVLFVLSSHSQLGDTGRETGWYLPEAAHPWTIFQAAGFASTFVSPKGGRNRMDGLDPDDAQQTAFLAHFGAAGPDTLTPDQIDPADFDAILFVGGHGTMWDFADNAALGAISAGIYEHGGVVSALCHGPAGLVNVTLSDGTLLVAGRNVTAFTDAEESAVGLADVVPFLLASTLERRGAVHHAADNFTANVVVDERLVTGQNPASAVGVANAVVELLRRRVG
jgi:putative intracellular protease/amidase